MPKNKPTKPAKPFRYGLHLHIKSEFEGAGTFHDLYNSLDNLKSLLRQLESSGVEMTCGVDNGYIHLETNDAKVARRYDFFKRSRDEMEQFDCLQN